MGSSKKHKEPKEKKKRHRRPSPSHSDSNSPDRPKAKEKEKHRHHKKHHKEKKREKQKSRDVQIISDTEDFEVVGSLGLGLPVPPPPKISRPSTPPPPAISAVTSSGSRSDSLSIDETNKLRARLGLKPLKAETGPSGPIEKKSAVLCEGGTDMGEFVHKPAESITQRAKQDKVKQKLKDRKEKRLIESKLSKVRTLGESDDEEDTSAWVQKTRYLQAEKDKAAKRAKLLEDLDAEFGVGDLVEEEIRTERRDAYSARDLRGLRVEHTVDGFDEGRSVILTLKDQGVLDKEDDVLINVNMVDDERYQKSNLNKKQKPHLHGYNAYDDAELDEFGDVMKTNVLGKYDEEIAGEKKTSFAIGEDVSAYIRKRALQHVKNKLHQKKVVSLEMPSLQLASEYYTQDEIDVKFRKTKKKVRKIRKKTLKASDLVPQSNSNSLVDFGSRRNKGDAGNDNLLLDDDDEVVVKEEPDDIMDIDDSGPLLDLSEVKMERDTEEVDLQFALKKAKRLKLQEISKWCTEDEVAASTANEKPNNDLSGYITLNATAEFCRTLGDIPTYGQAGNREEDEDDLLDYEQELKEEKSRLDDEGYRGAWNAVKIDETPVEVLPAEVPILDAEPDVGMGVAGALRLALSKGYLEKEDMNKPSASRFAHLQAQNYSIEDKTHNDDDKFGRRERYNGPTSDFKEKDNFKPNVKLDYIDDDGHILCAKEAFRYLSHKFHGKGPGKNKVEKRMKKNEQEGLMKCMSSTDTPLGTLNLLQQKQKETQSAYIVLSGTKQASISKAKH